MCLLLVDFKIPFILERSNETKSIVMVSRKIIIIRIGQELTETWKMYFLINDVEELDRHLKKDNTLSKLHIIQKTTFQMNQRAQCENQNSLSIRTLCAWISLKPKIMKYFLDSKGNRGLINLIT